MTAIGIVIADKVNARGATVPDRLDRVNDRIDDLAAHGLFIGAGMSVAAMATQAEEDLSRYPTGFSTNNPANFDTDPESLFARYDEHAADIAGAIPLAKVFERLF